MSSIVVKNDDNNNNDFHRCDPLAIFLTFGYNNHTCKHLCYVRG